MKRSAVIKVLSIPLIGLLLSCEKSNYSPSPTYIPSQGPTQSVTLNLVANNWVKGADAVYTSTLWGVVNRNARRILVYVRITDRDLLISSGGIVFMNGHLQAEFSNNDIRLVYHYFGTNAELPFSSLGIKVVFEN